VSTCNDMAGASTIHTDKPSPIETSGRVKGITWCGPLLPLAGRGWGAHLGELGSPLFTFFYCGRPAA
jgi:hypothetical protein